MATSAYAKALLNVEALHREVAKNLQPDAALTPGHTKLTIIDLHHKEFGPCTMIWPLIKEMMQNIEGCENLISYCTMDRETYADEAHRVQDLAIRALTDPDMDDKYEGYLYPFEVDITKRAQSFTLQETSELRAEGFDQTEKGFGWNHLENLSKSQPCWLLLGGSKGDDAQTWIYSGGVNLPLIEQSFKSTINGCMPAFKPEEDE